MEKTQKSAKIFSCDVCDFISSNSADYKRHLSTQKHTSNVTAIQRLEKSGNVWEKKKNHVCENCDKAYCDYSGLWRHKKTCNGAVLANVLTPAATTVGNLTNPLGLTAEMFIEIVKQNKELQELLANELKNARNQITMNNNSNNNTNSNNSFNIQLFLNEQCKNAVNIMDFVNSLPVTVEDLERTGKLGYVEGITAIFLNGLKNMDVHSRPIHCTDLKREIVYVKDEDKWEKEGGDKPKLRKAVKRMAIKNIKQITNWKAENPDCLDTNSPASDMLVVISQKALGGMDEKEDTKFQNSIMRNILKNVTIDKSQLGL